MNLNNWISGLPSKKEGKSAKNPEVTPVILDEVSSQDDSRFDSNKLLLERDTLIWTVSKIELNNIFCWER